MQIKFASYFFRKELMSKLLKLKNITKEYKAGNEKVQALKGIDIEFRENEFVSILGQSRMWKNNFTKYYRWTRPVYNWRFKY